MSWLVWALAVLATARATRIVTTDDVTAGLRQALLRRYPSRTAPIRSPVNGEPDPMGGARLDPHPVVKLVNCDWCVSFWLALVVVLAVHFLGYCDRWQLVALAWWGTAGASGVVLGLVG